uniref:Uncharacterized protein n=1 Tax=Loa loa TaxID=7209 RepID=A0A1I7VQK7_LOALO
MELIRCVLQLMYEKEKRETSKKELPILVADKDSLGENTIYKRTISTSLPKITKNGKELDQKFSNILSGGVQHGISRSPFACNDKLRAAMPSLERAITTQSVPIANISQKPRLKMTKSSHKKSVKERSINKSKKSGENIKRNLKLKISIPLKRTQVDNISEERHTAESTKAMKEQYIGYYKKF